MSRKNYLFAVLVLINYTNLTIAAEADTEKPKYPLVEKLEFDKLTFFYIPEINLQVSFVKKFVKVIDDSDTPALPAGKEERYTVAYNGRNIKTNQRTIFYAVRDIYNHQKSNPDRLVDTRHTAFEKLLDSLGVKYKKLI